MIIRTIVHRIPSKLILLYQEISRGNGCTIEIRDDVVVKRICVSHLEWNHRYEFLNKLYTSLIENSVPCVPECRRIEKCLERNGPGQFI